VTDSELAAIEARAEAATKGPWVAEKYGKKTAQVSPPAEMVVPHDDESRPSLLMLWGSNQPTDKRGPKGHIKGGADAMVDATFIAHARQDVPALCRELRATREALKDAHQAWHSIRERATYGTAEYAMDAALSLDKGKP
jgi:hypothetical protein